MSDTKDDNYLSILREMRDEFYSNVQNDCSCQNTCRRNSKNADALDTAIQNLERLSAYEELEKAAREIGLDARGRKILAKRDDGGWNAFRAGVSTTTHDSLLKAFAAIQKQEGVDGK